MKFVSQTNGYMHVVVLASESQRVGLGKNVSGNVIWVEDEKDFLQYSSADAFLHLNYTNTTERNDLLIKLLPKLIVINSVRDTLQETNDGFVRINGWNTFLSSSVLEASANTDDVKKKTEEIFALFDKNVEWLRDEPGFITARVVSMIVNEAYMALSEGVSTKEEINTAMKLGTAYPYGPFEWAEKIGLRNIAALLQKLSSSQPRYEPATLLIKEAFA